MADWGAMKTEYITTATSYRKLAAKYGVSSVQVGNVGKQEGWVELRKQYLDETFIKTVESLSERQVERAERFMTVADRLLERIEQAVGDKMSPKDIRALSAAMKDLREIQGFKSELDRKEQEARIRNLEKMAEKADGNAPAAVEILFDAGPEEWNE